MRFNNNFLWLASFLGVATALRRGCRPDTKSDTGAGFYTFTVLDTWISVAGDFCTNQVEMQKMNPGISFEPGDICYVPCKVRTRDCSRIPGSNDGYYTVVEGDEVTPVAEDFCSTVEDLTSNNPDAITSNTLTPGTILKVPCSWN
ncbi:uncharacterized protein L3040_009044 [Drepanopeziza brunnea f. sp. 'multigermtubi']|uniref:LysM15p n=2 Tax=Drepanopeziza brunnea f. sp. 'multigermtubi' TaxID=698441 RepID=J9XN37_9HELO|nr:putative Ecp7(P20) [Drepanopeziza brunnea f. sp. 'multigermtubi' MB_m1]AFS30733.1 LysM15p [Drepanopeziza brunnea f. sp. 'multigermtubi']EKD11873.1 putative Ecp7(P20) [Drepanopeziza brunnea f. sp. 'multigermtubi' MB_m1]KAJ5032439.1 hypothetical protein L3040_009044 [Drepanopeziza brunnea f. sp. 'multigermtubi']